MTLSADSPRSWNLLARAAAAPEAAGEQSALREFITCRLADAPYAIPIERVREIVRLRRVTPIPLVPEWILGAIALRGEIVQVVDLRMRLGLVTSEPTRSTRIVVLHGEDGRDTGVLVDAVREVLRVDAESLRPTPGTDAVAVSELIVNGDEFVSIIEVDRVLEFDAERD